MSAFPGGAVKGYHVAAMLACRLTVTLQVAFVDPPKLDFDLKLPSDSHGSGLLDYVSGWADGFITDNILSKYVLPDHFFTQLDGVRTFLKAGTLT